ncbi:hypothetical protein, partial [Polaromonas eurypsychrophila]|uniref:hypothetical protein n=1 Tax=Polaromonas eurypsychrophila TaxID=1614635 RepID=UPI001E4FFF61
RSANRAQPKWRGWKLGFFTASLDRMKVTFTLVLTATALWSLILAMGFAGIDGVRSQNVPGVPI